jgi:hypothetical protein
MKFLLYVISCGLCLDRKKLDIAFGQNRISGNGRKGMAQIGTSKTV